MMDEVLIAGRALSDEEIGELGQGVEAALGVSVKRKLTTAWARIKSDASP